ncbi:retrovirus-related Pol polyprotein from transposon 412 [Trichonephila clavata]|uniref:Retrovirus-related Pol polyprotein from transposon 412 n=1 Tax=Trichonephila clavata TaxID=2740835 RepID=A0A8X6KHD6_TRICU|nr:retrovirus-related Pol polyprotein from transposon 412 [Trichonephila clavata]
MHWTHGVATPKKSNNSPRGLPPFLLPTLTYFCVLDGKRPQFRRVKVLLYHVGIIEVCSSKVNTRFLWSKDCQVAFEQIKKEICSPKVLVHYDPSLPLTLASDASPVGIGCVLSYGISRWLCERPIAFASRTLSGRFTLITDHKPLVAIFGSKRGLPVLAATRLLHYALILQSFEFDIIFRKTIEHGNADFLSRLPETPEELEVKDDITIFQMSQIETLPVTSKENGDR